jgi:hypothetical protein
MKTCKILFLALYAALTFVSCSKQEELKNEATQPRTASLSNSSTIELLEIDDCCVSFLAKSQVAKLQINFGDGHIRNYTKRNILDPIKYCYSKKGKYNVVVLFGDGTISRFTINITANCDNSCFKSTLCWDEIVCPIECATSVRLKLPTGQIIDVPFQEIFNAPNICNDPYFQNPIPAILDITGGYCEIATQINTIITDLGFTVDFSMESNGCFKGGNPSTPLPSFNFMSTVQVLAIMGNQDCASNVGDVMIPFEQVACN